MFEKILNRISFGVTTQSLTKLEKMGYKAYLNEQLNPSKESQVFLEKKQQFKFSEQDEGLKGRKFQYFDASLETLWKITKNEKTVERHAEAVAAEVVVATYLRAVYSPWQLRELLVQFWHNHFNISVEVHDAIPILLPLYDRDVIREHCLGNFRAFLEAVAKSQAMLFYLDNAFSRASPANENYARELFELHTLGEDNYYNHLYNKWREVPGAIEGKAVGYIDEDIYEAARAFTGWTVADGDEGEGGDKPNTGDFLYVEKWHDNYQKRVLGIEFASNQAPMADGRKVLDILATHPGTARFICTKLCRKFIADHPPKSVIDKAVKAWLAHVESPDQIKRVVEVILLSDEFEASLGTKVKNPFELLMSTFRTLDVEFKPNLTMNWMLREMGYHLFTWPTPTGHPDEATYWLNSNMLLKRWNIMPMLLFDDWHGLIALDWDKMLPETVETSREIVQFWVKKLLGKEATISKSQEEKLIEILLSEEKTADDPPLTYGDDDRNYRFAHIVALILMSPQFQYR